MSDVATPGPKELERVWAMLHAERAKTKELNCDNKATAKGIFVLLAISFIIGFLIGFIVG